MANDLYRKVSDRACKKLVLENHYIHSMPSSIKLCYALMSSADPPNHVVACCIFSTPVGRWEVPGIWELTRLVRQDDVSEPLTKLISMSVKYTRKVKSVKLLISFADREEDHHGGIYQASSWIYSGMAKGRLDGFNIDGIFVPARTCNSRYGTSSVNLLISRLPNSVVVPHFDQGKYIYWKPLNKEGMSIAVRMGLKSIAYPKPMIETGVSNKLRGGTKGKIDLSKVLAKPVANTAKRVLLGKDIANKKPRLN